MFCSKCGKNVDDGVGFCPSCGTKVGGGVTACAQRPAGDSGKVSGAGRGKLVEYLVGAVFAVVVACGVLYRIMGTGPDLREEATGLLRGSLVEQFEKDEDTKEVAKYIKLTDVRDCFLMKEAGGRYSGSAQVEFTANKVGKKGETRRVVIQYDFTLLYDGENLMLKDIEVSDSEESKFTALMEQLAEEEEGEGEEQAEPNDGTVMTGSDFIKEWEWIRSPERTSAQREMRFKQIKGRRVAFDFDNAYITNVKRISSTDQQVNEMIGIPVGEAVVKIVSNYAPNRKLRMTLVFSDKGKAMRVFELNKGTMIKHVTGKLEGDYEDIYLSDPDIAVK